MKAGKLAIWPWLSCPYNKNALVDLPSSVVPDYNSRRLLDGSWQLSHPCPLAQLLLLANATLKHKTPRSENWMAYATKGMELWLELLNFVQKLRLFSF